MKIINYIVTVLGFDGGTPEFWGSLINKESVLLNTTVAGAGTAVAVFIGDKVGLDVGVVLAGSVLLFLEVVTGLWGSISKGIKFESKKFPRFGLKLFVWVALLYAFNALRLQYKDTSMIAHGAYDWVHVFIVGYIFMDYVGSIIENLGKITGKDYGRFLGAIRKKIGSIASSDVQNLEDYLIESEESLHIVDENGTIVWANPKELDFLGYDMEEYAGRSITEFHRDQDVISDMLERLLGGETLNNYSAYLKAKDGSVKRVLVNSSGHWKAGKFIHTRCFSRDASNLDLPEGSGYSYMKVGVTDK